MIRLLPACWSAPRQFQPHSERAPREKAYILMIITSRTPLRISLFGGGTDYPAYFQRERGAVLGFAINRYIYISAMPFQCFVDYRFRLSYSRVEITDSPNHISHP